ncbi:MAG: PDDEXK nuclease domain-containing protein [Bacteroidia bacterium]|nr:PDDEXK nuclease domain-containing protein [Bacteroidia bacterium]
MSKRSDVFDRIVTILELARSGISRTVNTTQVVSNWLVGRELVEEEQRGRKKAGYGDALLRSIAERLQAAFGGGYSHTNLKLFRQFYQTYPNLLDGPIGHTLRDQFDAGASHSVIGAATLPREASGIGHTACDQSWMPGLLHQNLAWSVYRHLIKIDSQHARAFYEIEAINNSWTAREVERQINSLLFERLAKSKDKAGLMKLATKGQEIATAADVFKEPVVIEFLGLPESHRLVESDLEQALINNLQDFLLELGKGFAFVSRQERITLDGDHFYIDLVFYHTILKCFVLIDLKVGKLTHGDLGQMQLYVNYFNHERRTEGDNTTLGLILCTDKNEAVVKYLLGPGQPQKIFTSRYKLHLPTEAELTAELQRELKELL